MYYCHFTNRNKGYKSKIASHNELKSFEKLDYTNFIIRHISKQARKAKLVDCNVGGSTAKAERN